MLLSNTACTAEVDHRRPDCYTSLNQILPKKVDQLRTSARRVNPHLKKQLFGTLYQTIVDLKNTDEVQSFLEAFLSESEHETLAKRLAVSYWLDKGRGYNNIRDNLKVSSATIASIQNAYNSHKGVKLALSKINADEWANVWSEKIKKFLK